jgi:hypothetical protein
VHEQMAVAIEVMSHTGCPALGLTLEAEIRILQFQGPVNLLQRHWRASFRQSIKDENSVVVRRLGQILLCVSRLRRIVGRR